MGIEVWFLGTSSGVPTLDRGLPCIALRRMGEVVLFDCGESSQRQAMKVGIGLGKIGKVFITHLHGDHSLGLVGLLQTMRLMSRGKKIRIFGPEGLARFIEAFKETLIFKPAYEVEVKEVGEGLVYRGGGYRVEAVHVDHVAPSLAYSLVEDERPGHFDPKRAEALGIPKGPLWKQLQMGRSVEVEGAIIKPEDVVGPPRRGLKIVYSGDTAFCEEMIRFSKGADLLIHEATFDDSLLNRAIEEKHSVASQAAEVAKLAGVKKLVLTHISPRYRDSRILLEQASKIFSSTMVAEDFLKLDVDYGD